MQPYIDPISRLSKNTRDLFNDLFNILGEYDLLSTQHDFNIIKDLLSLTRKEVYNKTDKYIIVHYDTDYYLPNSNYGLAILNLVKTFNELDIPLHTMVFVSNHTGITKEFKELIPSKEHSTNFPIIIDNYLTCFHDEAVSAHNALHVLLNSDKIVKNAMCLMGAERKHRNIVFNAIKDNNILDNIAVSYLNKLNVL